MSSQDAAMTQLNTARLLLRMPREDDLDAMLALHADPVSNGLSSCDAPGSRACAAELMQSWLTHWREHGYGYWAMAEREQPDLLLGLGGLMNHTIAGRPGLYLYFRVRPSHWGQGYANEMAMAVLEHAFTQLHLPAVQAVVQPANMPSRKTLERVGMRLKGSLAEVPGQPACLLYEVSAARYAERPKTESESEPTLFGA